MSLEQYITHYGYVALAIGCLLEGETVLALAGFAVHRGLLDGPMVFAVATVSAFAGDQFWFWIGRRYGPSLKTRFATLRDKLPTLEARIAAHPDGLVLGLRFLVGLRTIGPIILGGSPIRAARFAWLNLVGALLWVCLIGMAGYCFGALLETWLPTLERAEAAVLIVLLSGGWAVHWLRKHLISSRSRRSSP